MQDLPTTYCEQLGFVTTQWFNIITNLAFVFFAILAVIYIKKNSEIKTKDYLLPFLLSLIGVGSFLWHTFPANWSDYADTISIIVFSVVALVIIIKNIFKNNLTRFIFVIFTIVIALYLERLSYFNGSLPYVFLLILLTSTSIYFSKRNNSSYKYFKNASILFTLAIFMRSIDVKICESVHIGTHFLWHIFIAWMGYNLILGIQNIYKK